MLIQSVVPFAVFHCLQDGPVILFRSILARDEDFQVISERIVSLWFSSTEFCICWQRKIVVSSALNAENKFPSLKCRRRRQKNRHNFSVFKLFKKPLKIKYQKVFQIL